MARKKYFFVFCAIFFALLGLLGLGAWRTRTAAETQIAEEPPAADSVPAPAPRRLADPAPPSDP